MAGIVAGSVAGLLTLLKHERRCLSRLIETIYFCKTPNQHDTGLVGALTIFYIDTVGAPSYQCTAGRNRAVDHNIYDPHLNSCVVVALPFPDRVVI